MTRTGDFSSQAQAYAQSRPGYPPELLEQLIHHVGVRPGDPVADIGAGTGLFTAMLAQRGLRVTALEPGDAMRAEAPAIAGVTWTAGSFEATGLAPASQRWVTAAQAFHWADPARALPKLHRILAPAGHLTVLWNNRRNDAHPVLAWTWAAIRRHVPDFDDAYRDTDWAQVLTATGDFSQVTTHEVAHTVAMSPERYANLWRSHNLLNTTAGPRRFPSFIAELTGYLEREAVTTVAVPYLCRAWTAVAQG